MPAPSLSSSSPHDASCPPPLPQETQQLIVGFEQWMRAVAPEAMLNVSLQFNQSGRDSRMRRGLIATRPLRRGAVAVSLPINPSTLLSIKSLTQCTRQRSSVGSTDHHAGATKSVKTGDEEVLRDLMGADSDRYLPPFTVEGLQNFLASRGIFDTAITMQVYFALLLAAERMNEQSTFRRYLDLLPHPAVDDAEVMKLHAGVLDPTQLLEWDSHQREFLSVATILQREWVSAVMDRLQRQWQTKRQREQQQVRGGGAAHQTTSSSPTSSPSISLNDHQQPPTDSRRNVLFADAARAEVPPVQVVYWAIRTVLARHFLIPRDGVFPQSAGSNLDLYTFNAVRGAALGDSSTASGMSLSSMLRRIRSIVQPSSAAAPAALDFQLEPMLVPLIDFIGHVSPANVALDVKLRPAGPCVELKALDSIAEGEEIGAPYNSGHSVAFTLYRFGFLPV